MKKITSVFAVLAFLVLSAGHLVAQAIIEYGKGLERVSPPTGGGIKAPGVTRRGSGGSQGPGANIPPIVLPTALTVKENDTQIYAQQDEYSGRVEKVHKDATLTPMGQATVNGEKWYMVRSPQGEAGWVKAAMVEEVWPAAAKTSKPTEQVKKGQ
jgi:hypothetical protein